MMQKNDVIELTIEDMGIAGEGIGKYQGMTFFVKDAVIGDVITAKIMKLKKQYGYARLMEIKEASPNRVEPPCFYARSCGGCQVQALSYEKQLEFKQKKVFDHLIRLGGFSKEEVEAVFEPIVGMEEPFHYRNKAQFPVGVNGNGETVTGFYAGRTHDIIANTDCKLGVWVNEPVLKAVLAYMKENYIRAYDEKSQKGLIRHVLIRYGFDSKEVMVCLIINGTNLPQKNLLIEKLCQIEGMKSISLNSNKKNTNVILGDVTRTIWGTDTIQDSLYLRDTNNFTRTGEKTIYKISPESFYQVNPLQTEKLYSLALEYAGLTGKETVWDLYCGIGTISLFLAKRAKQVYGVEIVPKAIEDARENAALNGITNAKFYVGKAEEVLPECYAKGQRADVIVVDPPRKGCDERCLDTILSMRPEKVVYVSCDSATLARDLRVLCEGGYEVKRVRAVDQFGMTVHVESIILLSRKTPDAVIEVNLDMSELDITSAESKATYEEIKAYVKNKYDLKVTNLYIAQVKQEYGIIERQNFNVSKKDIQKVPVVTAEKRLAIVDALKYFQMI